MSGLLGLWLFYGLVALGVVLGYGLAELLRVAVRLWPRPPQRVLRPTQVASVAYPPVNGIFVRELR